MSSWEWLKWEMGGVVIYSNELRLNSCVDIITSVANFIKISSIETLLFHVCKKPRNKKK